MDVSLKSPELNALGTYQKLGGKVEYFACSRNGDQPE
jgi:hypothetical protein